ncbi:hypothetical protein PPL_00116 [Heterostelium album PN500]|uniref:Tetratricopeptide repeat protein 5 OB fold domain-containing protein n=1 Tax=Heterostelium pallidum (strain ATCC 26659 / Pp 5 / PN500) TaxID=670386 RepID=D3AVK3_HETP5|nr:hypothetical protein PPL_00116 [Heterostelium album PN500]EFA86326.1 hypothetical protein PPL_00116 [Heterostelium album PN500]|eukprot:XP_020438431.1 hypothetical protein PPL_00116 [Heterostelium album PN500]
MKDTDSVIDSITTFLSQNEDELNKSSSTIETFINALNNTFINNDEYYPIKTKAYISYLYGKLYYLLLTCNDKSNDTAITNNNTNNNSSSSNFTNAENYLSKAVKLDDTLEVAWNELGELYWRKNCLQLAMKCFQQSLQRNNKNVVSLQKISIVLRQLNEDNILKKRDNVERSVKYAKEALAIDFKNSESWYILGNSYLSSFFIDVQKNESDLNSALKAYSYSEQHSKLKNNPDLYYNRATEDYQLALEGFTRALEIENKPWSDPIKNIQEILSNTKLISDSLNKINNKKKNNNSNKINTLLNYSPMMFNNGGNRNITKNQASLSIQALQVGLNKDSFFIGKIKRVISPSESVPRIAICSDRNSQLIVLSIYNITSNAIKKGDLIGITDPTVKEIQINWHRQPYSINLKYLCIQAKSSNVEIRGKEMSDLSSSPTIKVGK